MLCKAGTPSPSHPVTPSPWHPGIPAPMPLTLPTSLLGLPGLLVGSKGLPGAEERPSWVL